MKIIKYYADWCGPCKAYAPVFDKFKESHPEIECISIDIDKNPQSAERHGIRNIPATVILYDEKDDYGIPKNETLTGALTLPRLEELIKN